ECFTTEVGDVIENFKFVENEAIEQWFNTYDKDQDGFISEAKEDQLKEKLGGDVKLVDLFLEELGQGGNLVSHFEFDWYVKQQDFADCYEDKKIVEAETKSFDDTQLKSLDAELKLYIEEEMTEYDIEEFFDILDADDDHDIDIDDFKPNPASHMIQLLELIDKQEAEGDEDTPEQPNVNYREFWLWLNNDAQDGNQKIKNIFEKECTKPEKTHFAEIYCYVKTFKNPEKFTA
ncbi:hypothetical protein, partial [Pseudophaeobacter profundi]|uniref:hypothetical protein n=1 Tax=Pseudophaeobacter profundi TaxID=3034152 RepID=UPI002432F188